MGYRECRGAEAVAVAAFGEEVQFGWDLRFLEGLKVEEGVLFVDGIVLRLEEEGGRRFGSDVKAGFMNSNSSAGNFRISCAPA